MTTTKSDRELAEQALDAACKTIQDELGVTDGGYAGMFFSDGAAIEMLMAYVRGERSQLRGE